MQPSLPDRVAAEPVPPAMPEKRRRMWPVALALLVLSPLMGDVLSGSTPPLALLSPFPLIVLPTLYGIWAILIHEIVARRGLGWGNALLLGAAFGIFQEALVVQTWFLYGVKSSPSYSTGTYGVLWGTNWLWGFNLSVYHAVVSILTPLLLIAVFFPVRAEVCWLRWRVITPLTLWMLLLCGALAYEVAFKMYANQGYAGPPLVPYLICAVLTVALVVLGATLRLPTPRPNPSRAAPRLWTVRLTLCALMALYTMLPTILFPAFKLPVWAAFLVAALLVAVGIARVRSWSARAGWGARHWLAVATGVALYFALLWAPLIEFGLAMPGQLGLTALDLVVAVLLLLSDSRLKRRLATTNTATTAPALQTHMPERLSANQG